MSGSGRIYSLREIAGHFGGEIVGDPEVSIARVATLESAEADCVAFLANPRYAQQARSSRAGAVIVSEADREVTVATRIVCANPYLYFARVSALLNPAPAVTAGVHASAVVDPEAQVDAGAQIGAHAVVSRGAKIAEGAAIGAGCYIGEDAEVGRDTRLHAGVSVYARCVIGRRVIVHSGAVIGADGFGIAFDCDHWVKVPQIGRVVIGDDVEIGANTTIDRGAIDDTIIEDGVKLDNQIQIAHNVRIGAHTAIAACTGIAGSARVGRHCRIGGGVGIAGHVRIADGVEISGHTAVTRSIDAPGAYTGVYPFEPNRDWRRNAAQLRHLADIGRRIKALERSLKALERPRGDEK